MTFPRIFMFAGPNGSGKTTTALSFLQGSAQIEEFINADEIAKGLAPIHPESMTLMASKLMITRLKELLNDSIAKKDIGNNLETKNTKLWEKIGRSA